MASKHLNLAVKLKQVTQFKEQSQAVVAQVDQVASRVKAMGDKIVQTIDKTASTANRFSAKISEMGTLAGTTIENTVTKATDFGAKLSEMGVLAGSTKTQFTELLTSAQKLGDDISSSVSKATTGMQSLKSAGLDTNQVMAAMSDFKGLADMVGMGDQLETLGHVVSDVLPTISQLPDQMQQVSNIFKNAAATSGIDTLGENFQKVRSFAGGTQKELRKTSKLVGLLWAKFRRGDDAVALMDHSLKIATSISEGASKVESLGNVVSEALTGPTNVAIEFSDKIAGIASAANATDTQLAQLTETAKKLGQNTAVGASQAANGMKSLADAGLDANQVMAAMPNLINVAKASGNGGDLAAVGNVATSLMSSFGIVPEKMGQLSDVLAQATASTGVDLHLLGDTMQRLGPIARKSGMDLKETAAMASLLADMGLQGADASAALESTASRLAAPSGAAAETLRRLGISTKDASGNMRGMVDVLDDVAQATQTMKPEEQLQAMQNIVGQDAATGLQRVANQNGVSGLAKYTEVSHTKSGASASIANDMDHSLQGGVQRLSSTVESIQLKFGEMLLPVKEFAGSVVSAAQNVQEWTKSYAAFIDSAKSVHESIQDIKALGEQFPALKAKIGRASRKMKVLMRLSQRFAGRHATQLIGKLKGIGASLLRMVPSSALAGIASFGRALMGLVMGAIPAVITGMRAITAAFVSNPIGLIIAAVVAVAALIYYYWEPIKAFMGSLWDGLLAGVDIVWDVLKTLFSWSPLGLIMQGWGTAFQWIEEKLHWFKEIKSFFGFGADDDKDKGDKALTPKTAENISQQRQAVTRAVSVKQTMPVKQTMSVKQAVPTSTVTQIKHAQRRIVPKVLATGVVVLGATVMPVAASPTISPSSIASHRIASHHIDMVENAADAKVQQVKRLAAKMKPAKKVKSMAQAKKIALKSTYQQTLSAYAHQEAKSSHTASIPAAAHQASSAGSAQAKIAINQLDIHVHGTESMDNHDLASEIRHQFMQLMHEQQVKYRGDLYDY